MAEESTIKKKAFVVPKGVTFKIAEGHGAFPSERSKYRLATSSSAVPVMRAEAAASDEVGARLSRTLRPAAAAATPTLATAPEEAPTGPAEMPSAADIVSVPTDMIHKLKARVAGRTGAKWESAKPPGDSPQISRTILSSQSLEGAPIKAALSKIVDAEIKPMDEIYRPISSGDYRKFIYETYSKYSLFAQLATTIGRAPQRSEKTIDKNACAKRDPNKVEFFYYQKFVRDYLSRGTPYRGLLVYHGLGSGKTCTSIAAAEALYWGGRKTIWVLTPATLSNNYRKDLAKCGFFPLRTNNYWQFLKTTPDTYTADPVTGATIPKISPTTMWLTRVMGLPEDIIVKQGGAWVPDPSRDSNWSALSHEMKESIRVQMDAHLNHRFKFIHYNGVTAGTLSTLAYDQMKKGRGLFDDAVVVIDEIHNLVRTINGTRIGSKPVSQFIHDVEPISYNWNMEKSRDLPPEIAGKFKYPRGYTLYRLLQNAVNAKIIALSATPMINYAQEFAILLNIIGGEQRTVEISLAEAARGPDVDAKLQAWARNHPHIDFFAVEESNKKPILTLTPVPFRFKKVIGEGQEYIMRGFVRIAGDTTTNSSLFSHERNMEKWAKTLIDELVALGVFTAKTAEKPDLFRVPTYQLLMDNDAAFITQFINRATLTIMKPDILKARATGLISYYRGGSEELMPRSISELVRVPMSEYMFTKYVTARGEEIDMESKKSKDPAAGETERAGKRGRTAAEMDLYAQAVKTPQTGFLSQSRAACNWVFPEDVPRPSLTDKQMEEILGGDAVIAADMEESYERDMGPADHDRIPRMVGTSAAAAAGGDGGDDGEDESNEMKEAAAAAVIEDEQEAAPTTSVMDATMRGIVGTLMQGLEAKGPEYLRDNLATYSAKYAEILARIRVSPGPALVYSQFKTLEGLGIFAAALRAAEEGYLPLDIQKDPRTGDWEIPAVLMDPRRPRYILYTGDQALDKRRLLLQLYNADVAGLPARLAEQCRILLGADPDNRNGRVARVFMITQSGAEGISLFNTRQVHIMEPYWNNVRLQQVTGRAIRLCSHMNLPWDDRIVNVYTYLSVFSEEQKAVSKTTGVVTRVVSLDGFKTTDEKIFELAEVKQRLADGLFEIAQTAATDCAIHSFEQGDGTVTCYQFPVGTRPTFMYHPDIKRDLALSI